MLKYIKYISNIKRMSYFSFRMEFGLIQLISFQSLTIVTKSFINIFDVSGVLDPPLAFNYNGRTYGCSGNGVDENANISKQGGGGNVSGNVHIYICSIKYLVQNLLAMITRFFVAFIKIAAVFKIPVFKKNYVCILLDRLAYN